MLLTACKYDVAACNEWEDPWGRGHLRAKRLPSVLWQLRPLPPLAPRLAGHQCCHKPAREGGGAQQVAGGGAGSGELILLLQPAGDCHLIAAPNVSGCGDRTLPAGGLGGGGDTCL
ncbi:hypothetical protein NDU88_005460 [Pleurodeles waltl]|uniref:Uncharacterized protein n=1 Tax=Pleurodeles waltl TaxID=8319 RepID=A0AAV7QKQ8_PLEWA|nr:hypothetical protein NDU88_005460 [Pleurodeles waltl]